MVFDDEIDSIVGVQSVGVKLSSVAVAVLNENGDLKRENGNNNSNGDKRDLKLLEKHYCNILNELGEDLSRQGLKKTPERAAKAMLEFTKGYGMTPSGINTFFFKFYF